jgi:dTDP-4-dehydrorhamnose reductase
MKILVTGASGMVGERLLPLLPPTATIIAPSHRELDITQEASVQFFFEKEHPDVVIHAAAIVDPTMAERERGDKTGIVWKVNVEGTRRICEAAENVGAYVVYLSSGSVFAGTPHHPGPFTEDDPVGNSDAVSWYGVTKAEGERYVSDAIVRLSRPIGGMNISSPHTLDYLEKLFAAYEAGTLFPLFPDQYFPLNYIPDIATALTTLITTKHRGVLHIATSDMVAPLELFTFACRQLGIPAPHISVVRFEEFIKTQEYPRRFTQYSAIDGRKSLPFLGIPERTWQWVVTQHIQDTKRAPIA